MKECGNCIDECLCNLCVCCRMFPCICSMRPKDFITDEELHKNCINKEKIVLNGICKCNKEHDYIIDCENGDFE